MGDSAFSAINDALAVAKVHVAVVSKGYAESQYCLSELVAMLRRGKPMIPVFFDVEPAHLRRVENGPFASAFEKHKGRESPEQVKEWAGALRELAGITGSCFRSSDYEGDELEPKWKVVDAIQKRMMPTNEALQVGPHVVGLEERMKTRIHESEKTSQSDTAVLGLVGTGGIGKTSLAKAIYNHLEVTTLSCEDSEKLFNWHAFRDEDAPKDFEACTRTMRKACGGLPLALKVIGSSLFDERSDEGRECIWPEAADALRKDKRVMNVLQWRYKCLS